MVAFKTLIFTVLVPGTVAFGLPWLLLSPSWGLALLFPSVWLLGFLPLLLGVVLYLWCACAFTFIGKGTPAPIDAPIFLVKAGPYHWVRNPMYLAVLSMVIGQAILFRSFLLVGYALLVWAVVHVFVVFVEEPSLRDQFGEGYESYLQTVPRWIPRFPHQRSVNKTR